MAETVFAIRAHEPSQAVARLHNLLAASLPERHVVVVVDELHDAARRDWPSAYELVSIDDRLLESVGLRTDITDAGWRCGDYAYYALAAALEFENAWLIEPDVGFSDVDVRGLLERFATTGADLIASDIRPAPDWMWAFQLAVRGVEDPWRCFFPMTRMSRAAIESSLRLRRRVQWIDGGDFGHPNDEGIVASAVAADGLTWEDLRCAEPELFTHFHHRPKLHPRLMAEHFGGPAVIHPAVEPEVFDRQLRRALLRAGKRDITTAIRERRRGPATATLEALGDFALLTDRQRAERMKVFGPPDAQSAEYDAGFRRDVIRTLTPATRAILMASGALARFCETSSLGFCRGGPVGPPARRGTEEADAN